MAPNRPALTDPHHLANGLTLRKIMRSTFLIWVPRMVQCGMPVGSEKNTGDQPCTGPHHTIKIKKENLKNPNFYKSCRITFTPPSDFFLFLFQRLPPTRLHHTTLIFPFSPLFIFFNLHQNPNSVTPYQSLAPYEPPSPNSLSPQSFLSTFW
jgi:hypothetical protein